MNKLTCFFPGIKSVYKVFNFCFLAQWMTFGVVGQLEQKVQNTASQNVLCIVGLILRI